MSLEEFACHPALVDDNCSVIFSLDLDADAGCCNSLVNDVEGLLKETNEVAELTRLTRVVSKDDVVDISGGNAVVKSVDTRI